MLKHFVKQVTDKRINMIVEHRWVYSKYGSAQEYFISKQSKYKHIVEYVIMSFSDRYCINAIHVDKYSNKHHTIITINVCNDATDLFDKIDSKIIETIEAFGDNINTLKKEITRLNEEVKTCKELSRNEN